jgi:hypothetical protein
LGIPPGKLERKTDETFCKEKDEVYHRCNFFIYNGETRLLEGLHTSPYCWHIPDKHERKNKAHQTLPPAKTQQIINLNCRSNDKHLHFDHSRCFRHSIAQARKCIEPKFCKTDA